MRENELDGEQGWVGYRLLASHIRTAKDTFEQAGGFDDCFETTHVERVGCGSLGPVRTDVEGVCGLSAKPSANESKRTHH